MKDKESSGSLIKLLYAFLGGTLLAVVAISIAKPMLRKEPSIPNVQVEDISLESHIKFDSVNFPVNGQMVYVTTNLVSNGAYNAFFQDTGYQSVNERLSIEPNWKSTYKDSKDPVLHLQSEDIKTFLDYLQKRMNSKQSYDSLASKITLSSNLFFRLPSVEELEEMGEKALSKNHSWEWTSSSLKDVDPSLPNASDYLSFWRLIEEETKPQVTYLRERDLKLKDLNKVGFRLAWSQP
jgi:hypothetical protein